MVEALKNHRDHKETFAILHAVTAAELVLKARLARISPTLVRKNIDAKDVDREQTVALRDLPQRLANLGVALEPKGVGLIRLFAEWRNEIVHHLPTYDAQVARAQVPRLLNFIADYLDRDLDTPLRSFLPRDLYRTASEELEKWKLIVASAVERAQAEGQVLDGTCPDCGARGVLSVREDGQVQCHLCDSTNYHYGTCSRCGRQSMHRFFRLDEENYCNDCVDAAGDAWLEMQAEIRRGK